MRSVQATGVVLALLLAGCGVPTDESAQAIPSDQLPESLRPDFTTTTTTTVAPPLTEPSTQYLLWTPPNTERILVVAVSRDIPIGASFESVIATLFGVPATEEEQEAGYFNSLFEFQLLDAGISDSVATIDIVPLDPVTQEPSPGPFTGDLRVTAAQLVYTATEVEGVDSVVLLINGELVQVPTSDADAEPGATLSRQDYERFNPETLDEPAPTTTTSEPPPSSSEPTTDSGADGNDG